MSSYPNALDSPRAVGDAVAAIETYVGISGSTDTSTLTGRLNATQLTVGLPHRSDVSAFITSAVGATTPSNSYVAATIYAIPFFVPTTATYARVGVIRTVVVANGQERVGVYTDAGGIPGNLMFDVGTIPATTTVGFKQILASVPMSLTGPQWVWLAVAPQTAVNTLISTVGTATGSVTPIASTTPHTSGVISGYAGSTSVTGTLPSAWGTTYTERAVVPMVYMARI